ncbi:MAG: hypothetical protein IRZ31_19990 [Thermogemmatispora sp.]|uniref:LuxR C-terminal-related transcriptional regulator n=1 Tax=Thermogemmatispora sp. TaxID=1968838 RepID=UPI00261C7BA4|nr:LuxR C-terminal-related transcriptional regulator [Thermogemmatispora sp.]MBX5459180.1 hypothetical protein [Thermogemmatispora sp.]
MTLTCRPRADDQQRRPLTMRQWQIVLLLRRGLSRQAVAAHLGLAPHTVAVHLSLLRQRLCLSRHCDPLAHVPWEQCPPDLLAWCQNEPGRLGRQAQADCSTGEEVSSTKEETEHEDPPAVNARP